MKTLKDSSRSSCSSAIFVTNSFAIGLGSRRLRCAWLGWSRPCDCARLGFCGKDGVVSIDSMAHACSPDANLPAVWLRHAQLRSLYRQGLLAEWQNGTDLDDAVFRLAATIPMRGTHLDQEAVVRHLRAGSAA